MTKISRRLNVTKRGVVRRNPRPRVLKASTRQNGKSVLKIDRRLSAMKPGKRRSASGNIYYEYRKNRSDL